MFISQWRINLPIPVAPCVMLPAGTSKIPLDGFEPQFQITLDADASSDALPCAHTCFNQLVVPPYLDAAQMRRKITFALRNTAQGFHIE